MTDAFLNGDVFEVFDNNVSIGQTSAVAPSGSCGDDPVPCFGDPASSSAEFPLGPGNHSITITPTDTVAPGAAYFAIKEMTLDTDKPRMPALQQQLDLLGDDGTPDNVRQQAVAQIVQALMAPPIILPTMGDPNDQQMVHDETMAYHNRALLDREDAIDTLTYVKWDALATPDLRAEANAASAFLESVLSVVVGVADHVGDNAADQPNRDLPKQLRGVRELDAPFVPMGPRQTRRFPVERTETCNVGFSEESSIDGGAFEQHACVITKEVFGLKAVLHRQVIPVYQEPWDVRVSPIIGHKVVWFIKFTPAEHIKVISHTLQSNGRVKTRINQYDVLMPGLSKFWSFYPPDVSVSYDNYNSD